jgi:hypothetical protein
MPGFRGESTGLLTPGQLAKRRHRCLRGRGTETTTFQIMQSLRLDSVGAAVEQPPDAGRTSGQAASGTVSRTFPGTRCATGPISVGRT